MLPVQRDVSPTCFSCTI